MSSGANTTVKPTYNLFALDNIGQVKRDSTARTRFYYLKDHLGDTRVTVNASSGIDSYFDYYPFGQLLDGRSSVSSADARYKYTGKERDAETGWDYFGARYYDARMGRFLSIDPHMESYPFVTPYCYAGVNPVRFCDPTGKDMDDYHFDSEGNVLKVDKNDKPDRVFVKTPDSAKESEITSDSDLGCLIRATYAEMTSADDNSKVIAAETIANRTQLPDGTYEKADSYEAAINTAYDVSKTSNPAHDRYADPQSVYKGNKKETDAFVHSASAAIKVHFGNSGNLSKGAIFYDSKNAARMDKNRAVVKITLAVKANGIAGLWKLKDK